MCWYSRNKPIRQIADKNIKVYKILQLAICEESVFLSPYYHSRYVLHVMKDAPLDLPISHPTTAIYPYTIDGGLHSYSHDVRFVMSSWMENRLDIYASISNDLIDWWPMETYRFKVMECIIPKGAKYYDNGNGLYVSNQLIPKKVIPIKELIKKESVWNININIEG